MGRSNSWLKTVGKKWKQVKPNHGTVGCEKEVYLEISDMRPQDLINEGGQLKPQIAAKEQTTTLLHKIPLHISSHDFKCRFFQMTVFHRPRRAYVVKRRRENRVSCTLSCQKKHLSDVGF